MVLFEAYYEDADFREYSGTNGNPTVVDTWAHHGTYSQYEDGGASPEYAYVSDSFGNTLYMRGYFYFDQLIDENNEYTSLMMYYGGTIHRLRLFITGGTLYLQHYDGSTAIAGTDVSLSEDTPYCIEWRVARDASAGESQCWINSVQQWNTSSLNTGSAAISMFFVGGYHNGSPIDWYADCIVVDSSRVGCEGAAGLSVPVAMHHYNRINHIIRG